MACPEHPGSPGWTGPVTQCAAKTKQEAPTSDPDLPSPGPREHSGAHPSPSSNSSMTTRELQEYWKKEKCRWKHVKLLFEIASARIEERKVSKFVGTINPEAGGTQDWIPLLTRLPAGGAAAPAAPLLPEPWAREKKRKKGN